MTPPGSRPSRHVTTSPESFGWVSTNQFGVDRITVVQHTDLGIIEAQLEHDGATCSHASICLTAKGWRRLFSTVTDATAAAIDTGTLSACQILAAADVLERLAGLDDNPLRTSHTAASLREIAVDFFTPEAGW
jgi:hypothetical protein